MIDHAITPTTFVLTILLIVVIALVLALLIERVYPSAIPELEDITPTLSPEKGDQWVGIVVIVAGVIFLISEYANDWTMLCR